MPNRPQAVCNGLTFWPIPVVSDPECAFGLQGKHYFHRHALPKIPSHLEKQVQDLFFNGGRLEGLSKHVDVIKAERYMRALLSSFAPAHEAKIATAAYALWVWQSEVITSA